MREGEWRALLIVGLLLGLLPPERAEAVNPETLLMPGKLSSAHAKYEEQCTKCHDRAAANPGARQTQLCLACHEEIAADIQRQRGFHGHTPGMATTQCAACHTEHTGRGGDIVKLVPEQFNHDLTDYRLRGAHADVACNGCHFAGRKHRDVPRDCLGCHKKEEPHEGRLGRDCASCHDDSAWRHVRYDHDKTSFPLRDAHTEVACAACHFGNRYRDTPKECVSCHEPDDVHNGKRGAKCAECHTARSWKTQKFDHEKETGFALLGVHNRIACNDCHRSGNLKDKLPKDCFGCHQGEDSHAGRMGRECGKCHGNDEWKPASFDHVRDGHWALEGRHQKIACEACHTAPVATQKLSAECLICHRPNDVHAGKLGKKCEQCHTPAGWRSSVSFDHDLTSYPLVGLHVAVPCEQCHLTRQYRDVGKQCVDCHGADDVHLGQYGRQCDRCHSTFTWKGARVQ